MQDFANQTHGEKPWRRFLVPYKLPQPLSGRAFSKRLTEDFINTAAAGTAQGLNLKHVLL